MHDEQHSNLKHISILFEHVRQYGSNCSLGMPGIYLKNLFNFFFIKKNFLLENSLNHFALNISALNVENINKVCKYLLLYR